ncbi:MAG: hypothetical protein WAK41_23340, partial [Roseiarcus sp.]|uniref:hypothetical protein n=1 Tax=Roseiarcus sp. TaxID=1969460 RepID=UPI003BAFB1F0
MTRSLSLAFVIGVAWAAPSAALAQEPVKPVHAYHHPVHHHPAHRDATVRQPVPAPTPESAGSMFKPYAHPGDGDDDGISRDPDDCMKGCIGGNPG